MCIITVSVPWPVEGIRYLIEKFAARAQKPDTNAVRKRHAQKVAQKPQREKREAGRPGGRGRPGDREAGRPGGREAGRPGGREGMRGEGG